MKNLRNIYFKGPEPLENRIWPIVEVGFIYNLVSWTQTIIAMHYISSGEN